MIFDKNSQSISVKVVRRIYQKTYNYPLLEVSDIRIAYKKYWRRKTSLSNYAYFLFFDNKEKILLSDILLLNWKKEKKHPLAIEKLAQFLNIEIKSDGILTNFLFK